MKCIHHIRYVRILITLNTQRRHRNPWLKVKCSFVRQQNITNISVFFLFLYRINKSQSDACTPNTCTRSSANCLVRCSTMRCNRMYHTLFWLSICNMHMKAYAGASHVDRFTLYGLIMVIWHRRIRKLDSHCRHDMSLPLLACCCC